MAHHLYKLQMKQILLSKWITYVKPQLTHYTVHWCIVPENAGIFERIYHMSQSKTEKLDVSQKVSKFSERVTRYIVPGQLLHYQYRFSYLAQTCTVYLYELVIVRCIPGSPLPGCVDDASSGEGEVDSLVVVVVSEVVVCGPAVYTPPNIY